MKRILITGGAGFVGSSLALRLQGAYPGAEVICLDNLYRNGSELNRDRAVAAGCTFVKADVREPSAFDMPACDLIVDAAAEPSVLAGRSGDARYVVDTNLGGTINVLEAAREWSSRVLFLSTSRVYPVENLRRIALTPGETRLEIDSEQPLPGITPDGIAEGFPLAGVRTLYGATKYASEIMAAEYAAQFGLPVLLNRCGVLAGPWQMGRVDQGVFALWIAAHHFGRTLRFIGFEGKQVRDVLHVEDLGDLVLRQLERPDAWDGRVYNVGGGRDVSVSLRELTALANEVTGNSMDIANDPAEREGDVPLYITDARCVRDEFEWAPARSACDIATDIAGWISENENMLRPVFCG